MESNVADITNWCDAHNRHPKTWPAHVTTEWRDIVLKVLSPESRVDALCRGSRVGWGRCGGSWTPHAQKKACQWDVGHTFMNAGCPAMVHNCCDITDIGKPKHSGSFQRGSNLVFQKAFKQRRVTEICCSLRKEYAIRFSALHTHRKLEKKKSFVMELFSITSKYFRGFFFCNWNTS